MIYDLSARHADLAAATPMPTPDMGGVGGVLEWLETQRMRGRSGGGAYRLCRWSRSEKMEVEDMGGKQDRDRGGWRQ